MQIQRCKSSLPAAHPTEGAEGDMSWVMSQGVTLSSSYGGSPRPPQRPVSPPACPSLLLKLTSPAALGLQ
jgi:hypothetical protein